MAWYWRLITDYRGVLLGVWSISLGIVRVVIERSLWMLHSSILFRIYVYSKGVLSSLNALSLRRLIQCL